jgi:hypothetical protein
MSLASLEREELSIRENMRAAITLQMKHGSGDAHLVLADAVVLAVVLRPDFGDVESHGRLVAGTTTEKEKENDSISARKEQKKFFFVSKEAIAE